MDEELLCRVCSFSKLSGELENIFKVKILVNNVNEVYLHKFILKYCEIKLLENDGLPQNICIECKKQFSEMFRIIYLCQESDRMFRESLLVNKNAQEYKIGRNNDICEAQEKLKSFPSNSFKIGKNNSNTQKCELNEKKLMPLKNIKRPFDCNECDLKFKSKSHLNSHQRNIHKGIKRHCCEYCNKTFYGSSHLKIHLMSHTKEYPYLCNQCGKKFAQPCDLREHQKRHSGIKDLNCPYCDYKTGHNSAMKIHIKGVHNDDKKYQCSDCGLRFMYPSGLAEHMTIHSGSKSFTCICCNKAFRTKAFLRTHVRTHSDEKPYKCQYCNKMFRMTAHRTVHERIHTGEKPYICVICNKAFQTGSNLHAHQKIHNKIL